MKHTPAPWKVTKPNTTYVVCDVKYNHFIAEFANEDNAILVHAAPDMLEALQDIVNFDAFEPDERPWYVLIQNARAAIAKATE